MLYVVIVVNVNRAKDFAEIRKHEQEMERQVMQNVRRMAHDTMTEKQEVCVWSLLWYLLVITFRVSRRWRKMYCGHVCLSVCPWPHAHTIAQARM